MSLDEILDAYPNDEFLIADGFNEAVIGVSKKSKRLIYSTKKCVEILMKDMCFDDALEYFYYNVEGSYMGAKTPIWRDDL